MDNIWVIDCVLRIFHDNNGFGNTGVKERWTFL